MRWVAAHEHELAEPPIDEEGADDADYHDDQDDAPLMEYVFKTSTVYLVHAQEEPEVRRQACVYMQRVWGERRRGPTLMTFVGVGYVCGITGDQSK